jgi:polyisoprenoid-binding protein YceI
MPRTRLVFTGLLALTAPSFWGQAQVAILHFVPTQSTVNFTLGDVLHTVHGSFQVKSGEIHFTPVSNQISGEIIVDGTSGASGNGSRDKKMHREILESVVYPDIVFRPDRVEGAVALQGQSGVRLHGRLGIHGVEHEITVPVLVNLAPDRWSLTARFAVPYVKWGLKDPSTFLLRVDKTVDIEFHAAGTNPWSATQPE